MTRTKRLLLGAGSLLAGLSQPFGLAPFDHWWLALAGLTLFAGVLSLSTRPLFTFALAWLFGFGLYGAGVYWIYISIHVYGYAPAPLALTMTGLFAAFVALLFALPFWLLHRYGRLQGNALVWALPALWVLNELFRSWIFTGFPWLYSGYSQLATPLAGWAPIAGVYGVSLALVASAASLVLLLRKANLAPLAAGVALALWLAGGLLLQLQWTQPVGPAKTVALVQPNIPQQHKWDPRWLQPTYARLEKLSTEHWDADWLIWPEAALPALMSDAQPFMAAQAERARDTGTSLVTGVIADLNRRYHNSLVVLGEGSGVYHKQRLVPFGEYVPLQEQLRGLIEFFDLPMSVLHPGPADQSPLWLGQTPVWPAVCYEIVYPDLIARGSRSANAILTVSNDAWFGDSTAPEQHLQMARMRALETGRPVVRATNDGLTAIIDHRGQILARDLRFQQRTLRGEIQPMQGQTPFMRTGSLPLLLLTMIWIGLLVWRQTAGDSLRGAP